MSSTVARASVVASRAVFLSKAAIMLHRSKLYATASPVTIVAKVY